MNTLIIGHRGVGKTKLLKRIKAYLPQAHCIDLDEEISKQTTLSLSDFFQKQGETEFRELERSILKNLLDKNKNAFISLGAGSDLSFINLESVHILWVKRKTDLKERFFVDRPPLAHYSERIQKREVLYKQWADEALLLPEGLDFVNDFEKTLFSNTTNVSGASLTLLPENFKSKQKLSSFLEKRKKWNLEFLEFRDDLLDPELLDWILEYRDHFKILYSFRSSPRLYSKIKSLGLLIDWDMQLGEAPEKIDILSSHTIEKPRSENRNILLKHAPPVESFEELYRGHLWQQEDSQRNSFLPRGGKWHWYRLFMKQKQKINFIREGDGSSPEQPTLLQWLMTPSRPMSFSAVLGSPVEHSRSPVEHYEQGAFFDIEIKSTQWEEALAILKKLGLKTAAVTSPLKDAAGFVNTLQFKDDLTLKTNTDLPALQECFKDLNIENFNSPVVWGGGGMLQNLKSLLPSHTAYYSARTGTLREGEISNSSPDLLVWAAGSSGEFKTPPENWTPTVIFDLSYTENSPGLDYAIKTGAKYISGLDLFKKQARLQKEFWK